MKIPLVNTTVSEDLKYTILLVPLWWILGINFFIFHFIALWMFLKLLILKKSKRISLPYPVFFLLIFILVFFSSVLVNLSQIPFIRLLATLYNLSFWVMGALLILTIYNATNKEEFLAILKALVTLGLLSGMFALGCLFLWISGVRGLRIKSLVGSVLPTGSIVAKAPLLGSSLSPSVVGSDWIFGRILLRISGFNAYPVALGGTMLFLIPLTLAYYKITKKKRVGLVLFVEFVPLLLSLSRISVLGLLGALATVNVFSNIKRFSFFLVFQFILLCIVILLVIIPPSEIVKAIYEFRPPTGRIELYKITLSQAVKRPVLGYGFKPRTEESPIPIGSHSAYVGVVYRTGFFGFLIFCLIWLSIVRKWWHSRRLKKKAGYLWYYLGIGLIGGLLWMFTEDLDAPVIVAFVYFTIVGLILTLHKLRVVEN